MSILEEDKFEQLRQLSLVLGKLFHLLCRRLGIILLIAIICYRHDLVADIGQDFFSFIFFEEHGALDIAREVLLDVIRILKLVENGRQLDDLDSGLLLVFRSGCLPLSTAICAWNLEKLTTGPLLLLLLELEPL